MEIALNSTSKWEFALEITDDEGPVDMTGKTCHFVMSTMDGVEIGRASTTGATGTIAITDNRLDVTIPATAHATLVVPRAFLDAYGDLGVETGGEVEWLGRQTFHILAGPSWTATGATGA